MSTMMPPGAVRNTRIDRLEADVTAGASCARGDAPADWFRRRGETFTEWCVRRVELVEYCRTCPVLAQCQEAALRLDVGGSHNRDDDFVRGGLTGRQLWDLHDKQRPSLYAAKERDARPEEAAYLNSAREHLVAAGTVNDHGASQWLRHNRDKTLALRAEMQKRRTAARRAARAAA